MSLLGVGAFYNEFEPYCGQWLRNLIAAGHIAPGDVDTRSILDVSPEDLRGYTQVHLFAGLGGWSAALRRAGWGDDRPIWSASYPCQPFSVAGAGAGFRDPRHLWPYGRHLIGERRPAVIVGEQVASKDADAWLDFVQTDLEALGYAFGAVAFPSAGVGAPHIRDRTYWGAVLGDQWDVVPDGDFQTLGLADAHLGAGEQGRADLRGGPAGGDAQPWAGSGGGGMPVGLGDDNDARLEGHTRHGGATRWEGPGRPVAAAGIPSGLADAQCTRIRGESGNQQSSETGTRNRQYVHDSVSGGDLSRPGPVNGYWRDADWLGCRDGKWRPVEPGTFPLAHGAASRVGRLRAYGNAINVEAARIFIEALMESLT